MLISFYRSDNEFYRRVIGEEELDECILGDSGCPMQTAIMILVVLLGILALPLVAGAIYQAIETRRDRRRFLPPGRLVRVNERRMHIHVTGEGAPTVVFESGMGASCLSWTLVQPQVAQFSRAVSYDRAGHGWSDPAPEPRTARQIAQELNTLLNATGLPGPYVLVGHSFGGYEFMREWRLKDYRHWASLEKAQAEPRWANITYPPIDNRTTGHGRHA